MLKGRMEVVGSPYARWNMSAYISPESLLAPYGDNGSMGCDSPTGNRSGFP